MIGFVEDINWFLEGLDATFRNQYNEGTVSFIFDDYEFRMVAVPLASFEDNEDFDPSADLDDFQGRTVYLYEDYWNREKEVVKLRIEAHLGMAKSVFARNCEVRAISSEEASSFLDQYHSYGAAHAKYRYGLFGKVCASQQEPSVLLAVSTFSAPRPMERNGSEVQSFEWVRLASFPGMRVVGGMGKLMKHFIDDVGPEEIMSYADHEWSDGGVYEKLGFCRVDERPAVSFLVDPKTMERISEQKILRDRKYRGLDADSFIRIRNLGSIKYLFNNVKQ